MESDPTDSKKPPSRAIALVLIFSALTVFAGAATPDSGSPILQQLQLFWRLFALFLSILIAGGVMACVQSALAGLGPTVREKLEGTKGLKQRLLGGLLDKRIPLERRMSVGVAFLLALGMILMAEAGSGLSESVPTLAMLASALLALTLHFLVVEVLARNIGTEYPVGVLIYLSRPARILSFPFGLLVGPFSRLFEFSFAREIELRQVTDMEFRLLPHVSRIGRMIEEETFEMIDSVREFASRTAESIMTPRTDLEGMPDDTPEDEIYDRLRKAEFSRVIVYHDTLDTIRGILLVKEVLLHRPEKPLEMMRKPVLVSETTRLPELLREIRRTRTHMVVVQDEYGGTSGIVTLHDLLELLVGDISEEDEEEDLWIEKIGKTKYRINGQMEVWEVNDELNLALDEEFARTIGGYIFNTLGRVANPGDSIEADGIRMTVEELDNNRVRTIQMVLPKPVSVPAEVEGGVAQ